ncbi:MAG: hypothetical protein M3410_10800 [Acidobacteriota bacterium]|nr:hypothetical protein [Acidobacteriota bacterium]
MKTKMQLIKIGLGIVLGAVTMAIVLPALAHDDDDHPSPRPNWSRTKLVVENAILTGLPGGALFPFIDSTPNRIVSTHIALTDATSVCSPGAAPPANLQVLVGVAGGSLMPVMTASTNTGIGSSSQCVFHVTVRPGEHGVPRRITDIVVVNGGTAPLTAWNTVTVSAEVSEARFGGDVHH